MTDEPDALPHCGQCHPALPNLARQLTAELWACSRCGRLWTPDTAADFQPARDVAGAVTTPVGLNPWEARLLLRVVDQVVRETEGSAVPVSDGLLNLRDKLAETLGRLRALEDALRRQDQDLSELP